MFGWNLRLRPVFLLVKPLHVHFHRIRLRKNFPTNLAVVRFLLKKVKSISFCQFKVFLPSCEISDELSFEFQCGNFYCIEGMDMAWSQSEHVHEQTDRNQIDKYCCLYTLYMSETFNKVKIC